MFNQHKFFLNVVVACSFIFSGRPANSQTRIERVETEAKWFSLGFSSLDIRPVEWDWLRIECAQGRVIDEIEEQGGKVKGIVVPVFDDGQCFYNTSLAFFNPDPELSIRNEIALSELIAKARQKKIKVLLGVNLFSWQRTGIISRSKKLRVFDVHPDWQEVPLSNSPQGGMLFATPHHPKVVETLKMLAFELKSRFPSADGLVIDGGLSAQEIGGFGEFSRAAAMRQIQIDPSDLQITGNFDEKPHEDLLVWKNWRQQAVTSAVKSFVQEYRGLSTDKFVWATGDASYYGDQEFFNGMRLFRDWADWLEARIIDGVQLEGRWPTRFSDHITLRDYLGPKLKNKSIDASSIQYMLSGNHVIFNADYMAEWHNVREINGNASYPGFLVRSSADVAKAVKFDFESFGPKVETKFSLAEVFPDFALKNQRNIEVKSSSRRGKKPLVLLVTSEPPGAELIRVLNSSSLNSLKSDVEIIVISSAVDVSKLDIPYLQDPHGEITGTSKKRPLVIVVDSAGFVRQVQPATPEFCSSAVQFAASLKRSVEIGDVAPHFVVADSLGRVVELAKFRGKKNVLLTFFPKCFTGGCQNHLSSLQKSLTQFQKLNTEVIAVSVDPPDVQVAFGARWGLEFTMLSDPGRNLSVLFGASEKVTDLSSRQTVLIDKAGVVRYIDRNIDVKNHGADIIQKIYDLKLVR